MNISNIDIKKKYYNNINKLSEKINIDKKIIYQYIKKYKFDNTILNKLDLAVDIATMGIMNKDELNNIKNILDNIKQTIKLKKQIKDIIQPELIQPELTQQDIIQPELIQQDIIQPELTQLKLIQPELTQLKLIQQEVIQQEVIQQELTQQEVIQQDIIQPELTQQDIIQQDIIQQDIIQQELTQQEVIQLEVIQQEVIQQEVIQQEVIQQDIIQPELTQPELTQPELTQPELTQQDIIQQELTQQELNTDDDLDKTYEQTYKQKQQECQEKNNNSTLITVQVRNPELQNRYRKAIIKRFDKCIISDYDNEVCEAAHIKPFSESNNLESEDFDIDNGLLLNCILHKLFDKHYWSINPITLCFEIFISPQNNVYNLIKQYDAKYIEILKKYPKIVNYLVIHYNTCIII